MSASSVDFALLRVMVVDDNRHMRTLVCSILHALKIKNIKEVGDGEGALTEINAFEPDIVITDWQMEPMDGMTLVKTIRYSSEPMIRHVPIIMLTGHADAKRVQQARDSGIHEFLAKPVSAESLLARLLNVMGNPRPFMRTDQYFSPDRRRQDVGPLPGETERPVGSVAQLSTAVDGLSPDEVLAS